VVVTVKKERREPRHTRDQAQAWRDEADLMRTELEAEKAQAVGDQWATRRRLGALTFRALLDDSRVVARVENLRDARERNHFAETWKLLLGVGKV
jgi:hypothetical protein